MASHGMPDAPPTVPRDGQLAWDFAPGDCREPINGRLYAYWLSRRGERRMPGRADIDPVDIPYALAHLVIHEAHRNPLRFRYRLVGTEIVARDGFDMTGRPLDDLPLPDYQALIRRRLTMLVERPQPLLVHNRAFFGEWRWYDYEALWLPLGADGRTVDMLMVCQIYAKRGGPGAR